MHSLIIPALAAIASASAAAMAFAAWRQLAKRAASHSFTFVHKQSGKTATLPRNYSPAAVEQLLELTA